MKNAMRNVDADNVAAYAGLLVPRCGQVAPTAGHATGWPQLWAEDTLDASKAAHKNVKITGSRDEVDNGGGGSHFEWPISLPPKYSKTSAALGEAQVVKGGCRFGALLLTVWPSSSCLRSG